MVGTTLKRGTNKALQSLFEKLAKAISESLGTLLARPFVVSTGEFVLLDAATFEKSLNKPGVVVRGALDKGFAGKTLYTTFEVADAVAMASMLMMADEATIQQQRAAGVLAGDDAQAFGELGNAMYSAMGAVLRENVDNVDVRLQDHATVHPGGDKSDIFEKGPLVTMTLKIKLGAYPESSAHLVVDQITAEAWNKAPLDLSGDDSQAARAAAGRHDDDAMQDIPAAPIRGTLSAFLVHPDTVRLLRRSCRRVGLELRRHGKTEIPNPAAHRQEIVVIDVPQGDDRRFDWCRRIKEFADTAKVVLLLQHPSRQRVTQAFLSRADAIVGFPCEEPQLSQKLAAMMPDASQPTPTTPPAS